MKILHIDYEPSERKLFKIIAHKHEVESEYLPATIPGTQKTFSGPEEFVGIAKDYDTVVLNRETVTQRTAQKPDLTDYLAQLQSAGYTGKVAVTTTMDATRIATEKAAFPHVIWFHKPGQYKTLVELLEK